MTKPTTWLTYDPCVEKFGPRNTCDDVSQRAELEISQPKISIYDVLGRFPNSDNAALYQGDVWLDIDRDTNDQTTKQQALELAIKDAQQVLAYLVLIGVDPESVQWYLSGNKGLHIRISATLFNDEFTAHLPLVHKYMAGKISKETGVKFDAALYHEGQTQLIRNCNFPRNVNGVTRYKVQITADELSTMTVERYLELTSEKRETFPAIPSGKNETLIQLFEGGKNSIIKAKKSPKKDVTEEQIDIDFSVLGRTHPLCIDKFINGEVSKTAEFNSVAMTLQRYFNSRPEIDAEELKHSFCENYKSQRHKTYAEKIKELEHKEKSMKDKKFNCKYVLLESCGLPKSVCRGCEIAPQTESNSLIALTLSIPNFVTYCPDIIMKSRNQFTLPATLENFKYVIKRYGFECEYDEILKKQIVRFNGCADDHPDLSDESAFQQIRSCCLKNDLPSSCTDNLINVFAANVINPVMEWIESAPWDGVDRIPELISTLVLEDENHMDYALQIIPVWLTQCVAALDGAKRTPRRDFIAKFELCLVFAGKQGGKKTSWFKALLPNCLDEYYIEGVSLILDEKDSIKQAVSGWIVELGEIDSTFRKSDIAQLKAFLSKRIDAIRLPYARVASNFARRTSFCGSVNEMEFLNDATGNRRFLPLVILSCNKDHNVNLQQLWAQMLEGYLKGKQWWLTDEQDLLVNQMQERHRPISAVVESLSLKFDFSGKTGREQFFSATAALATCKFPKPTSSELKEARAFIESRGIKRKKVNGTWGYYLYQRSYFY